MIAVTVDGTRDILGNWAGDGGEGATYWLHVFTELKNRGLDDVFMLVCAGLKGLPEAVETVWPGTIVQRYVVHLLRHAFRYAARQDWDKVAKALKPVYIPLRRLLREQRLDPCPCASLNGTPEPTTPDPYERPL